MTHALTGKPITSIPPRKREREKLQRRFPGLLTGVARRHRVDYSLVNRVWHGKATSGRIRRWIEEDLAELLPAAGHEKQEAA